MNATEIKEPRSIVKAFLTGIEDPRGWKHPLPATWFAEEAFAKEVAAAMDFYYGGHEISHHVDEFGNHRWIVTSRGYYHYIGS